MSVELTQVRWWQRVLLLFRPAWVTIDHGVAITHKTLFGSKIIVRIELLIDPGF